METYEIQQQLFNHLKSALPSHISLVDELCDLLHLSPDSVYRRIRGEKPIALLELKMICEKYHLSLDHVLNLQNNSVVFQAPEINNREMTFPEYLKGIITQLKYFNSFEKKQMLYLCKDLPFWHFYTFPEIAAFKTFVWIKTIKNNPAYAKTKFSLQEHLFEDCFKLGQEMLSQYNLIPSIELWNFESIISTTRQIEYYRDAGIFSNFKDLDIVVDSFERSIDHIQQQVEKGVKFLPGTSDVNHKAPLKFYVNEVVLGNNSIMGELNGNRISFVTYNVFDFMATKDPRFTDIVFTNFYTLLSRSSLISETGEKERNRFFGNIKRKIQELKK
ncbi:MAG: helix-turn-helix domain-containing protein [Bacteroidota bacterium]